MNATWYKGKLKIETDLGNFEKEETLNKLHTVSFETAIDDVHVNVYALSDTDYRATIIGLYDENIRIFNTCKVSILGE